MGPKTKHIDDVQAKTVDEHFKILMSGDKDAIDYDPTEDLNPSDLPDWYDEELFKAGQDYYNTNLLGITAATFAGLIAVFAIPSITKILEFTKRSGTPCAAFKRYLETLFHGRVWYIQDEKDKNSDWFKSTNEVRLRHSNVNRRTIHAGLGGITQRDMALTQFGFIGYCLIQAEILGLTNTNKEREGLVHFWRVVGHLLGISDRINLCRKNAAETTELCVRLKDEVFGKYFKELRPNFIEMSKVMMAGMWSADMANDSEAFFAFTYKLNDLPYFRPLSTYSRLNLKYRETVHKLCATPYIGIFVRTFFNHFISLTYWLMKHWPVVAWIQFGRENTKIQLYTKTK